MIGSGAEMKIITIKFQFDRIDKFVARIARKESWSANPTGNQILLQVHILFCVSAG